MEKRHRDSICCIIKEVDQRQKEAIISTSSCVSCDSSLVTATNNTIPISFYMCDGSIFKANLEPGGEPNTQLFRVEEVMDDCTIKCRLIRHRSPATSEDDEQGMRCSDQTCVIDLDCVCCIQCFTPIYCQSCGRS